MLSNPKRLALALGVAAAVLGASSTKPPVANTGAPETPVFSIVEVLTPEPEPFHEVLRPLGDLISQGEGDWNAVNRGYAGDTPGGLQYLFGKTCDNFTVGEILDLQAQGRIYAVGRYQFIPTTLRLAVSQSGVSRMDTFSSETQDRLLAAIIEHKRPTVASYLRGEHDQLGPVLDALAREWASIEYRNGRGYHDAVGGNRAHISRSDTADVLIEIREGLA